MKTSACSFAALVFISVSLLAQEPKIPERPPPNELIGRWLERTPRREGDLVGYNMYCFSRQAEFLAVSLVRNEKTKKWDSPKMLYGKQHRTLAGYVEATSPDALRFQIVVYAMAVLPIETRYKVTGDTLVLSNSLFDPTLPRSVRCERMSRLPDESPEEAAAFEKKLEGGLNGPDFRRVFESAAHEMKPHPSDEEMMAGFIEHRDELESLRKMMQSDEQLKRVDFDWTNPDDPASVGVDAKRIETYRELCRRVGLERGVEAFGDSAERVAFVASARGLSVSGSSKSYVWLKTPPGNPREHPVVEDLDSFVARRHDEARQFFLQHHRSMRANLDVFRHLEGNWYLEYEEN